jgi:hypothetical protein
VTLARRATETLIPAAYVERMPRRRDVAVVEALARELGIAPSLVLVEQRCGSAIPFTELDHLVSASTEGDPMHRAVETLLKGPEISLVDHGQPAYYDKDGVLRDNARVQWWNSSARTLRGIAETGGDFTTAAGEPYPHLPELELPSGTQSYVYTGQVPVFYGHYWRQGAPEHRHDWTDHTACVDFSAVKGGSLTTYRWSGENQICPDHYVPRADQ